MVPSPYPEVHLSYPKVHSLSYPEVHLSYPGYTQGYTFQFPVKTGVKRVLFPVQKVRKEA